VEEEADSHGMGWLELLLQWRAFGLAFFISCLDGSLVLPSELPMMKNLNCALLPFS
jgi:hypothetical protein